MDKDTGIEKGIVIIRDPNKNYFSNGYITQSNSEKFSYVLTARHCLFEDNSDQRIENLSWYYKINIPNLITRNQILENKDLDIAIIIIDKILDESTPYISNIEGNSDIFLRGFDKNDSKLYSLHGNFSRSENFTMVVILDPDLDSFHFINIDKKSTGYSGSPVFYNNILFSIFRKKRGKAMAQHFDTNAIEAYNNLLKQKCYPELEHFILSKAVNSQKLSQSINSPVFNINFGEINQENKVLTFSDQKNPLPIIPKTPNSQTSRNEILITQGKYSKVIKKVEDLEEIWKNRKYFLRDSHKRGVNNLSNFWEKIYYSGLWETTPDSVISDEIFEEIDLLIISGDSGSGKTIFLLTFIKKLIDNNSSQKLLFLETNKIWNKKVVSSINNSIIFIDLPEIESNSSFVEILNILKKNKCMLIITQYPEKSHEIKEIISLDNNFNCETIEITKNYIIECDPLKIFLHKIIKGWDIAFLNGQTSNEIVDKLISEIKTKKINQILLFCTLNLQEYKNQKKILLFSDIENFEEPYDFSLRILKKIPNQNNLFKAIQALIIYINWLKKQFKNIEFESFPINISIEGVVSIISKQYCIPNLPTIIKEARIFNSIGENLINFDHHGYGSKVLKKFNQNLFLPNQYRENELRYIKKTINNWEREFSQTNAISIGQILDFFKFFISPKITLKKIKKLQSFIDLLLVNLPLNENRKNLVPFFLNCGVILHNLNIHYAEKFYHIILTLDNENCNALLNLSAIYVETNPTEAYRILKKIRILEPKKIEAIINLGYLHMVQGNTNKSKKFFREVLNEDPKNKFALVNLLNIYDISFDFKEVENICKRLINIDKENMQFKIRLSDNLLKTGKIDEAIQEISEVLDKEPNNLKALMAKCQTLAFKKKYSEIHKIYEILLNSHKKNYFVHFTYAKFNQMRNNLALAEKHYKIAREINKSDINLNIFLYEFYKSLSMPRKAKKYFKRSLNFPSKNIFEIIAYSNNAFHANCEELTEAILRKAVMQNPISYEINFQIGFYLSSKQRFTEGMKFLQIAADQNPDDIQANYQMAWNYYEEGDYSKSITLLEEILTKNPKNYKANITLAINYNITKEYRKAEDILRDLKKDKPKDISILYNLSESLFNQHKNEEAKDLLIQLLEINENHYGSLKSLGYIYFLEKDYPNAEHFIHQAINNQVVKEIELYNLYAAILFAQGKHIDALPTIELILVAEPDNVKALINSSAILVILNKDINVAFDRLSIVIESGVDTFEAFYNYAWVCSNLGNFSEAETYYQIILNNFPHNPLIYYQYAKHNEKQGKMQIAEEYYLLAIKSDDKNDNILKELVRFYFMKTKKEPFNFEMYYYIALYFIRSNNQKKAITYSFKCIEHDIHHFEANLMLALIFTNTHDYQSAKFVLLNIMNV